jgi:hypothetical protein
LLERVAAPPKQTWLETLLAQVGELVEMDLECALGPAQLAPERAEMVEAARHQGREPASGLVLRLVELHRQIHIADIERAAGVGAEDPNLAHPRQVGAVTANDAREQTFDPLRRLRPLHGARLMRRPRRTRSVPLARESFSATILVPCLTRPPPATPAIRPSPQGRHQGLGDARV